MNYPKSTLFIVFASVFFITSCSQLLEKPVVENANSLSRSTPESQGVSSEGILTFLDSVQTSEIEFHGLMVIRHGQVISEGWWHPYKPDLKHQLYSLSKSFTSTAVGFAVQEGLLTLEDTVYKFFPEYEPEMISENLAKLKIKHLITMSTGHVGNTMNLLRKSKDESWAKAFFTLPIEKEPGSTFLYNTAATYMMSAIVQKLSGMTLEEFLKPRLFVPLGIEESDWMKSPEGINTGGYGLRVTLESVAKLGQLYLQKGKWKDKQIINEEWVKAATSKRVASSAGDQNFNATNDWSQGYGYQFWRNTVGGYRADGAFGQFSIVLPEYDAVVAINSQSMDMGATMKLVWNYLLPAFKNERLPEDEEANASLKKRLSGMYLTPPKTRVISPRAAQISGKTFELEQNDFNAKSVSFRFYENVVEFTLKEDGKEDLIVVSGIHDWVIRENKKKVANYLFPVPGRLDFPTKIGASATWKDLDTLILTWQFIETVHGDQLICTFDDDNLTINFLNSVAAGKGEKDSRKSIKGKIVE